MTVSRADGSVGRLGSGTVSVVGRSRELQEGRDAVIRVDGREVTRASNTITDAISGVTISLTSAEPGSSVDVSIDRDVKGSTAAVQKLVDTFNEIRTFFDIQREPESALYANSTLRGVVDSFNVALRTKVTTNESYTSLAVTGLALDRTGKLAFDKTKFEKALNEKPNEIEALFGFSGAGTAFVTATDNATKFGVGTISTQVSSIDANTVALRLRETAARNKLEQKRERLVADFTRMEDALSRLQSQSGTLLSSVNGLQSQR
jgi:flagellar hook-associated protein 2